MKVYLKLETNQFVSLNIYYLHHILLIMPDDHVKLKVCRWKPDISLGFPLNNTFCPAINPNVKSLRQDTKLKIMCTAEAKLP